MSATLDTIKSQMATYLEGCDQGPINTLNALNATQQENYAQAITAYSQYHQSQGRTTLGWTMESLGYGSTISTLPERSSVLLADTWNGGHLPQPQIDAQNNKNAQQWATAQGWKTNDPSTYGLPGVPVWIGAAGDWSRVATTYSWSQMINSPGSCAMVDLDVNSVVFGDDCIHQFKQCIETWVQSGGGIAYDGVWPKGYADSWNTAFQALHSQGHIFAQIAGPFVAIAGAVATVFSVGGASAAVGAGLAITQQAFQTPPAYIPGQGTTALFAQVAAGAAPAASASTQAPPALVSIQQFPWVWIAAAVAALGIGIVIFEEA